MDYQWISVKCACGFTQNNEIDFNNTGLDLKEFLTEERRWPYTPEDYHLIFAGKRIDDEIKLSDHNLSAGSTVYMAPLPLVRRNIKCVHPSPTMVQNGTSLFVML